MKEVFMQNGQCQFANAELSLEGERISLALKGATGGEYALIIKNKDSEKIIDIFKPQKFDFSKND